MNRLLRGSMEVWYHVVASGEIRKTSVWESLPTTNGVYADNLTWTRTYTKAGAKWMRVCFSNFHLEHGYDKVEIRNSQHHIIQVLTGNLGTFCSGWVSDSTIRVHTYTDYSVGYSGFTIERIESTYGVDVRASFPGHWKEHETAIHDENGTQLYTGLHYNWHRFYDPEVGRYIRRDPLGSRAGHNPYAYANNDPYSAIDPNGLTSLFATYFNPALAQIILAGTAVGVAATRLMAAAGTRVLAGQACSPGAVLRTVTQTGLLIGSAVTTGVAIAEFGQLSPDPGEELLAQILLALQRDLMRSIPCQILDSFGDYAVHIGNWNSASGFYSAALLCSFASPGTGAKGGNSFMMTGSGAGGKGIPRRLHPDSSLSPSSVNFWSKQSTDSIFESLKTGRLGSQDVGKLVMKPDGLIMNGNTRIKVLQERGFDLMKLWNILD